jgi:serine/threonine protein kinase
MGGDVLGTPDYLPPEQAMDSHNVDTRADIYSLGGTLYFLVTGEAPYSEEKSPARKLIAKTQRPPKPVREINESVPKELVAIIDKMMAREPADRYQTARDVADALAPWTKAPIVVPPEKELPHLSRAARTGQAKLGKDLPPPKPAAAAPWSWAQVAVVVVIGALAFAAAMILVGFGK